MAIRKKISCADLGVQFAVPLREEARNRTVRFVGADGGVWSEPLQPGGGSVAQETGQPFTGRGEFAQNAIWDDFKLSQTSPEGFTIQKRTNPKSTWLSSAAGKRASGLAFVGDLTGGLALSVKNFWQSYPAGSRCDMRAVRLPILLRGCGRLTVHKWTCVITIWSHTVSPPLTKMFNRE